MAKYKNNNKNYDQNVGIPGVVYILDNPALSSDIYKIGCTRYSGKKRANDLNSAATTGTPASFECIFEYPTKDCGTAEKKVFDRLKDFRYNKTIKKHQEYFSLSESQLANAKIVIKEVCQEIDYFIQQELLRKQAEARLKADEENKARLKKEEETRAKERAEYEEKLKAEAKARQEAHDKAEAVAREKANANTASNGARVGNQSASRPGYWTERPYSNNEPKVSNQTIDAQKKNEESSSIWWAVAGIVFLWIVKNSDDNTQHANSNNRVQLKKEVPAPAQVQENNGAYNLHQSTDKQVAPYQEHNYLENKYVRVVSECTEQIFISFAFKDRSNWITQGWWGISPSSYINTNIRSDSSSIYFYAYSKNHIWQGDEATGMKRTIAFNRFDYRDNLINFNSDQKPFNANFYPFLMNEVDDHFELRLTCGEKNNVNQTKEIKKRITKKIQKKHPEPYERDLPARTPEVITQPIANENKEIERLNEEARRLAKIADELQNNRIKDEERIIDNSQGDEIKTNNMENDRAERAIKMENKVKKALEEEKKSQEYLKMMERISKKW